MRRTDRATVGSVRRSIWLLALSGCVNEYVVQGGAGASTSGGEESSGSTTRGITDPDDSGGDASQTGSGDTAAQTGDTTPDTTPGDGSEDTSAGDGADEVGGETEPGTTTGGEGGGESGTTGFACEPCTADAECGDALDNCVDLGGVGLRCLTACPEGGCTRGLDCADTVSVDGVVRAQCVPQAPSCE